MSSAKQEAIAEANAYLNNVDLPNVYALAKELKDVIRRYRIVDPDAPVNHAALILSRIEPYLPANI